MRKSISLSLEETKDIINYIDTTIVYLENAKCRFKILNMPFYFNPIEKGISRCFFLKNKFLKLLSKFDNYDLLINNDDMFSTFSELLEK